MMVRSIAGVLCLLALLELNDRSTVAAELLTVRLTSGRRFTAFVDQRTNDKTLWLRFETPGVLALRPVDWDRVTSAELGGRILTATELKEQAATWSSSAPEEIYSSPVVIATIPAPGFSAPRDTLSLPATKVRSADFYARVANWNDDVNLDGLLLNVFPLNADGQAVPVSGTLEVDLVGVQFKDFAAASQQSRGYTLDRIGHWTQVIQTSDLTVGGIVVRLPFQSVHPEFNSRIGSYGLVHVRLAVPGEGVFEASHDGIRLRPSAPLRDAYELQQEKRFFPIERRGR